MRKFLLLFAFFSFTIIVRANSSVIAIDKNSGRILYENNAYDQKLIASTTKIMTAIIALENGNLDDNVEVSESILKVVGSSIYLEIGEKINLLDLIYGMMLRSGNDSAITISESISGNERDFVKLMNSKAKEIGMNNTIFINSHGLEDKSGNGNLSTAYDMALLMRYAMKNSIFAKIVSTKEYKTKSSLKEYYWKNKNKLLFNYKYTTGGKTGYTKKAHRVLVSSASKDNKNVIIVTINDSDDFNTHKNLYEYIFSNYNLVNVLDSKINLFNNDSCHSGSTFLKNNYVALFNKEEIKKLNLELVYYKIDNCSNNQVIGKIDVLLENKIIYTDYLYFKLDSINKNKSIFKRLFNAIFN